MTDQSVDFAKLASAAAEKEMEPRDGETTDSWTARVTHILEARQRWETVQREQAQLAKRPDETPEQYHERVQEWRERNVQEITPDTKPTVQPSSPIFAAAFPPGQVITDENGLQEFGRFLPKGDTESPKSYAKRLAAAGLALTMTSEETRDIPAYKGTMQTARQRGLPLVITTNPVDRASTKEEEANYTEARRAQLIADARVAAARAAVTNTPRG